MKIPFNVDRDQFIAWTQGILFERNAKGEIFAVNELQCQEAENILHEGGEVYLRVGDELVSKIKLTDDLGFVEEKV